MRAVEVIRYGEPSVLTLTEREPDPLPAGQLGCTWPLLESISSTCTSAPAPTPGHCRSWWVVRGRVWSSRSDPQVTEVKSVSGWHGKVFSARTPSRWSRRRGSCFRCQTA